jgi:hypothetical protein
MYFCPNCSYLFDISKSSTISNIDSRKPISKVSDILKLLDNDNKLDLTKFKAEFTKETIHTESIKYLSYLKINCISQS